MNGPFIVINVAEGAIQINQNTETLQDMQAKLANISQRLDNLDALFANLPGISARLKAGEEDLEAALEEQSPPSQP